MTSTSDLNLQIIPAYLTITTGWILFEGLVLYFTKSPMLKSYDYISNLGSAMMKIFLEDLLPMLSYQAAFVAFGYKDTDTFTVSKFLIHLVLRDLNYYLYHRLSHEVNFLWVIHSVHHSSENYQANVGLRQSIFEFLGQMLLIGLPFAACGTDPSLFLLANFFHGSYDVFQHSVIIPSLGFMDYLVTTPSTHRVHHGRNPYCIDKNYTRIFMIWDHIGGTFQREKPEEPVCYGLIEPIGSHNALTISFIPVYQFWTSVRKDNGLGNKLRRVFYGPGWTEGSGRLGDYDAIPLAISNNEDARGGSRDKTQCSYSFGVYSIFHLVVLASPCFSFIPDEYFNFITASFLPIGLCYDGYATLGLILELVRLGVGAWLAYTGVFVTFIGGPTLMAAYAISVPYILFKLIWKDERSFGPAPAGSPPAISSSSYETVKESFMEASSSLTLSE